MRTIAVLTTLALAATGCASDPSASSADTTPSETSSSTPAARSPLEGTWTTDLRRSEVRAYIRGQGWSRDAERVLLGPEMAGPAETEFQIDFVGDRFRMSQVSTDEQWQSGFFELEGGQIKLDDEAPVGVLTFRVDLDGDTARFDQPGPNGDGFEFMKGVPGWAPGAVLWASTTWERSAG